MGENCIGGARGSFVHGLRSTSLGKYSIAFGEDTKVGSSGRNSVVMGVSGEVYGKYSIAIGKNVEVSASILGGVALGDNKKAHSPNLLWIAIALKYSNDAGILPTEKGCYKFPGHKYEFDWNDDL